MISCLCEDKALINAYKCEITEKSHFMVVNGYKLSSSNCNNGNSSNNGISNT